MRRRDFLHVGFAGGIGLTLADFFRIKEAQADQKFYETKEGPAKSVSDGSSAGRWLAMYMAPASVR